jgi:hypothetical protein
MYTIYSNNSEIPFNFIFSNFSTPNIWAIVAPTSGVTRHANTIKPWRGRVRLNGRTTPRKRRPKKVAETTRRLVTNSLFEPATTECIHYYILTGVGRNGLEMMFPEISVVKNPVISDIGFDMTLERIPEP